MSFTLESKVTSLSSNWVLISRNLPTKHFIPQKGKSLTASSRANSFKLFMSSGRESWKLLVRLNLSVSCMTVHGCLNVTRSSMLPQLPHEVTPVMHLSMVSPTSPTWGRWGNDGGFVLKIMYLAPYMGHNYRVLPPSTPPSPIPGSSNYYCGTS